MIEDKSFQAYCKKKCESPEWQLYHQLMAERPEAFRQSRHLNIITDLEEICRYELTYHKTIGVRYQSAYALMVVDLVSQENGKPFCYERLLPAVPRGAVVGIPVYEDKFVLLNQFRHALRGTQYGFPRGFAEEGLPPQTNVCKELEEELGAEVDSVERLGSVVADSGRSGDLVDVFLCNVTKMELKKGYEGIQGLLLLSEKELTEQIKAGQITDGFTLSAFAMWVAAKL